MIAPTKLTTIGMVSPTKLSCMSMGNINIRVPNFALTTSTSDPTFARHNIPPFYK